MNDLINIRNHKATQILVKPSFGNILLWRTIYVHENKFYIDAVNTFKFSHICSGTSMIKESPNEILQNFKKGSVLYQDVKKFIWFSSEYVSFDRKNNMISDIRYAFIPNSDKALWGIKINEKNDQEHVDGTVKIMRTIKFLINSFLYYSVKIAQEYKHTKRSNQTVVIYA